MSDAQVLDFFDRLERELRSAAERAPRRRVAPVARAAFVAAAAATVLALALVPVLVVLGGGEDGAQRAVTGPTALPPVGTVLPKDVAGDPPRSSASTVVARGRAPLAGPWALEVSHMKKGRWKCLFLHVPRPKTEAAMRHYGGYCGPGNLDFRKTPGFSRAQAGFPQIVRRADGTRVRTREVIVFGRAPEQASAVVITAPGGVRIEADLQEGPRRFDADFYAVAVKPPLPRSRINWLDAGGRPGSRGITLMPPIRR